MQYEQRNSQARTDTTRHLSEDMVDDTGNVVVNYFEGARKRSARFAESTSRLREMHAQIDKMGRDARDRPTGILSGSDVDIAYHYLSVGLGVIALLYSALGSIFTLHGGGAALVATIQEQWAAGPATALANVALTPQTLIALVIQAVIFVVLIGTRRNRRSWQHWGALIASAALTYAGWSTLLLAYGTPAVTSLTATIPAVIIGGALGWLALQTNIEGKPSRSLLIGVIVAGALSGALGVAALIHWVGLLLAWTVDQVARRMIVVG